MTIPLRKRSGSLLIREVDVDLVLLDTESDRIHQLNRTAKFIWQQCDGAQSAERIADSLASEFAVESKVALKDVIETLDKLRTLNLVVDAKPGLDKIEPAADDAAHRLGD